MAQAALGAAGLHFDELNKLRVLEPEAAQQTAQLREECRAFLDSKSSAGPDSRRRRLGGSRPDACPESSVSWREGAGPAFSSAARSRAGGAGRAAKGCGDSRGR